MPIRNFRPTSPGTRFQTVQTFDEITTSEPFRPLTEKLERSGGRNNKGELTSWWRGGGHKRLYRIIDFKRDKKDIPAKVSTVEYDRTGRRGLPSSHMRTARSATSCSPTGSRWATRSSPATPWTSCRGIVCR
jgi:large subunit ribosomal protein L2